MYAVSKTALLGLTKGLAAELGPDGITVNCVAPGIVPTKFSAALVADPELVSNAAHVLARAAMSAVSACRLVALQARCKLHASLLRCACSLLPAVQQTVAANSSSSRNDLGAILCCPIAKLAVLAVLVCSSACAVQVVASRPVLCQPGLVV
jgi:NAD(P)-dependent dehydrogenase (short-subunit alcohol dehydrogenase family)